jgi:peptide/nickel transport system substrate-binding protein
VGNRPLLALLVVLCVACQRTEQPIADTPKAPVPIDDTRPQDGGTLLRRLDLDVVTLNPVSAASKYDRYVTNYLFTPLIYLDKNLQPIPGLADSWDISDDGLTYRFELNEKATFSDGTPVRASDVVFTLARIIDPASESVQTAGSFDTIDMTKTKAVDEHTVDVVFKQPLATQLVHFNDVLVVPEHVYSIGNFRNDWAARAVGSGPYKLVRRVPGKEVVIERRKDYWADRPHIQTIVFKLVADHGTAFNALKRGELDETTVPSDTWMRERNNPQVTRAIDFQRFYTLNYNYIAWNNRNPLLSDKRVRRAMSMCIPIDALIQDIYHGTARAMSGPFTPDEWAYNPTVQVIRYDPDGAKALLTAAGWSDHNADGVLDKDGKPFRFELLIMVGSATAKQIAQMIQAELKKIGVQVDIVTMDGAMAIQRILKGNYQAAYLAWELDSDPDPYALFHSSQTPGHGNNFVYYANPEADRLMEAARRELDLTRRKDLYWQLHQVLAEDQPYTWVIQVSAKWGLNKRLHNVQPSRGYGYYLWYPGELGWWIAPGPGDRPVAAAAGS